MWGNLVKLGFSAFNKQYNVLIMKSLKAYSAAKGLKFRILEVHLPGHE